MALHKPPIYTDLGHSGTDPHKGKGTFLKRVAGSILVVAAITGGIYFGGWAWSAVVMIISMGSLWEVYQIISSKTKISKVWGLLGGLLIISTVSLGFSYALSLAIIAIALFLVLFTETVRRQATGRSFAIGNMGGTLAGIVYVIIPWSFLIVIRSQTWGHIFLFTIFACTWSCDVAAYLVGSRFGTSPLCSRVSPKKTWEGFWGGMLASTACGVALGFFFEFPPIPLLLLGMLCGVAGQLGDLAESVLKREASIKDSGRAIPGHGGFLDRFDSILINSTLAFFIFEVVG